MKIEVSEQELLAVVVKQIGNLFIINESEIEALRKELLESMANVINTAFDKLE